MTSQNLAVRAALAALVALGAPSAACATDPTREPDVVFVPTPDRVVEAMMEVAEVGPHDVVYDLGCGDGRLVIAAAKRGAKKAVGVDIDPERIREASANARKNGVADKVKFVQADLFEFDFSDATVVTLYLLPDLNLRLRPKILALAPGTRVVSHSFDMGDWTADQELTVDGKKVYYWKVPERRPPQARTGR